jgi:hypothetical protein
MRVTFGGRRGGSETESGIKPEINTVNVSELTDVGTNRGAVKYKG